MFLSFVTLAALAAVGVLGDGNLVVLATNGSPIGSCIEALLLSIGLVIRPYQYHASATDNSIRKNHCANKNDRKEEC